MMAKKKAKKAAKKKTAKKKKKWSNEQVTSLPVIWIRDFSFLVIKLVGCFSFAKISSAEQAMRKTEDLAKSKSSVFFMSWISNVVTP